MSYEIRADYEKRWLFPPALEDWVSLASGSIRWQVPLGTIRDLAPVPLPIGFGVPNMGGPIVTGHGRMTTTLGDSVVAFALP